MAFVSSLYSFNRGPDRLVCEERLDSAGGGYQLVITTNGITAVESFDSLPALFAREHRLLQAWWALGWRETTGAATAAGQGNHHNGARRDGD